MYWLFDMTIAS